MKKKVLFSILVIALFSSALPAFAAKHIEKQILVTISHSGTKLSEMPEADAKNIIAQKAAEVATACDGTAKCYYTISISQNKIVTLITSRTKSTAEMQTICKARKDVLSAKPNRSFKSKHQAAQKTIDGDDNSNAEHVTGSSRSSVNDPLFHKQWALCGKYGLKATSAWEKEKGSPDVVIAVVDAGVDFSHEDLADNIAVLKKTKRVTKDNAKQYRVQKSLIGEAYINEDNNVRVKDDYRAVEPKDKLPLDCAYAMTDADIGIPSCGIKQSYYDLERIPDPDEDAHGTFIAGIIAAVANNGKGIAGLARGCKIAAFSAVEVYFASNNPEMYRDTPAVVGVNDDAINEIFEEIIAQKKAGLNIRVVNLSRGGWDPAPPELDDADYLALKALSDAGVIICVSAGNIHQNHDNPSGEKRGQYKYPPCYKAIDPKLNMIVVGATDKDGEFDDSYSDYGVTSVDIAAPGTEVYGTLASYYFSPGKYDPTDKFYYTQATKCKEAYSATDESGTSYATPFVAASAALLCSHYPNKTADEIIKLIYDSADDKHKNRVKYGVLNVEKALKDAPNRHP